MRNAALFGIVLASCTSGTRSENELPSAVHTVTFPTGPSIAQSATMLLENRTSQFVTLGENAGCCIPTYGESQVLRNVSGVTTASQCLDLCEKDPSCAAFDVYKGKCTSYKHTFSATVLGTEPLVSENCTCYVRKRPESIKCISAGIDEVSTIKCEYGSYISLVLFASMGPVQGSCLYGHVDMGICQNSAILSMVEHECLGRNQCFLSMGDSVPFLDRSCQQCDTGPLTVEVLCTENVHLRSTTTSTKTTSTTSTTKSCNVGSCAGKCQTIYPVNHCGSSGNSIGIRRTGLHTQCFCDDACRFYGDCCHDHTDLCTTTTVSSSTVSTSSETITTKTRTTMTSSTTSTTLTSRTQTTETSLTFSTTTVTSVSSVSTSTLSSSTTTTGTGTTITTTSSQTSITSNTVTTASTTLSSVSSTETTVSTTTESSTSFSSTTSATSSTSQSTSTITDTSSTTQTSTTTTHTPTTETSTSSTTIYFCSLGTKSDNGNVCCPAYCTECSLTGYTEFCFGNGTNKNPAIPCNPHGFRCTPQSYVPPYFSMPNAADPGICKNATHTMCRIPLV
eukprot:m.8048 g.8048  ORF g.8048 m.8048 type:complete len:563 (-) comp6038_c0_seq1:35-1723(-)